MAATSQERMRRGVSSHSVSRRQSNDETKPSFLFEMPIFILALVRIGLLNSTKLRRNRRIGYVLMVSAAVLLATVDPVSLAFEVAPLLILFESSIWLSLLMERRWQTAALTTAIDPA